MLELIVFFFAVLTVGLLRIRWPFSSPGAAARHENVLPGSAKKLTPGNEECDQYKEFYHKLQKLECFPEVLPRARELLVSLLYEGLLLDRAKPKHRSISGLVSYDPQTLAEFLDRDLRETLEEWTYYIKRREAGYGAELFVNREDATNWLKQQAPLNLIDGAWLGHIHKVTTPFVFRASTKIAWQILSEELGDGDLKKNHISIYSKVLQELGVRLPRSDSLDFIDKKHGLENDKIWKAAVGQLLISLFPNDFLPEALGFNMHFERLSVQTLKASKELPEFGIPGYYYTLHVSIDNADSGHSAMAMDAVNQFMSTIRETGLMDVEEAWERIKAGYLLSQTLDRGEGLQGQEEKLLNLFHSKMKTAGQIHCTSRVLIGHRSLNDWFSFQFGQDIQAWKRDFLLALKNARPWIRCGDSRGSRLVRELSWGGKMFGAFTRSEVDLLRSWIDYADEDPGRRQDNYWRWVQRPTALPARLGNRASGPLTHRPVFAPESLKCCEIDANGVFVPFDHLVVSDLRLDVLLPLWFVHPCILENAVTTLQRTTTAISAYTLQILRAELGFEENDSGCAGTDEQSNLHGNVDLVELGLEMMQRHDMLIPSCLHDILSSPSYQAQARTTAERVLGWAMRPIQNESFLLGLSRAFLDLEILVADQEHLLCSTSKETLRRMVERKLSAFDLCLTEMRFELRESVEFCRGYEIGRAELAMAFDA